MRLWPSDPRTMCRQHLHVECHMMVGALLKHKTLTGFYAAGLIDTTQISPRHDAIVLEMLRRGYRHQSPLPAFVDPERGWLRTETPQGRCEACRSRT